MMTKNQKKPFAGFKLLLALPLFTIIFVILCSFKPDFRSATPEISRFSKETIVAKSLGLIQKPLLQDTVYSRVEESPQFTGGIDAFNSYIKKKLNYPVKCKEDGIEGRVENAGILTNLTVFPSLYTNR